MINRLLFGLTFSAVGALSYGWYYNNQRIIDTQQKQIERFINAGPRFTAYDGKELCDYMNAIANHSIGFQKSRLPELDCEKYVRNK